MRKTILVFAALTVLSVGFYWSALAQAPQSNNDSPQSFIVSAKKYEFDPNEIRVKQGAKVELKVHSEDDTHGLKLSVYPEGVKESGPPGLLLDRPKDNGQVTKNVDQVIDFVAQQPGTYAFKCAKLCGMGHNRMKGKVIVEP